MRLQVLIDSKNLRKPYVRTYDWFKNASLRVGPSRATIGSVGTTTETREHRTSDCIEKVLPHKLQRGTLRDLPRHLDLSYDVVLKVAFLGAPGVGTTTAQQAMKVDDGFCACPLP